MKLLRTKWASLALVLTMLISLLPPLTASAAGTITVTNLYSPIPPAFDDSLVDRFTVNPITLDVLINGITDDQITNIYYEIYNSTTGQTISNTTNKPIKDTSNSSQVSFQSVQLTPGLNKIIVKYGQGGSIASTPSYAYYTPVTNITNLKFNGDNFIDGDMYPKQAPYTGASITGTSVNATAIEANLTGTVIQPAAFANGDFTFLSNTGRPTDLTLNPGDNKVTFAASNQTNYYTTIRSFIYDNGKSFAYKAGIDLDGVVPSQKQNLVDNPNLSDSTIKNISVDAMFKMPLSGSATVAQNVYVYTTGLPNSRINIDFSNSGAPIATGTGLLNGATPPAPSGSASVASTSANYNLYNFTGKLPINTDSTQQEVVFEFVDAFGLIISTSKYTYSFLDPSQPNISDVKIQRTPAGGGTPYETAISPSGSTQISEIPTHLIIYTNANTTNVEIKFNGVSQGAPMAVNAATNSVAFDLQNIPDGPINMEVIPYDGATPYIAGKKVYNLLISGAPYLIMNNIYNSMVVKKSTEIICSTGTGPCISGRVVNLPPVTGNKVEFSLNDVAVVPTTDPMAAGGGGVFVLSGTSLSNAFGTKDGKYTLKAKLFINNQLITTSVADIFVLSDDVPAINYLKPKEADALNPQFIATSQTNTYVTRSTKLTIQGETVNSPLNATPAASGTALYLRNAPSGYTGFAIGSAIGLGAIASTSPLQAFATGEIPLTEYGDYIFELVSGNSMSGSTANKVLTISREPVPYNFVSPSSSQIVKNSKGLDQVSINQNFYRIVLEADNADSVVFGKDQAIYNKTDKTYIYDVKNLKAGTNEIKFTVNRGTAKTNASIVLYNVNTNIEGSQFKAPLTATMKIFDGDIALKFPKDTKLMRNNRQNANQYITSDRQILFGLANNVSGQVDKIKDNAGGISILATPSRFNTASKKYWIDAGYIPQNVSLTNSLQDAYFGSGITPFPNDGNTQFIGRISDDLVVPTERGTLTLKYDSDIRDDSWKYLTVFQYGYFDSPNGQGPALPSWKNIGGIVDSKKKTIEVPIDSFGFFQVMYMNEGFADVTNHPWARDDLETLFSKGIMSPKTPYQFMPNDPIGRGEFVTMLVKMFDIPLVNQDTEENLYGNAPSTFYDVQRGFTDPAGLFDFLSIEAAARAGIIRGTANGTFSPRSSISRQDAAVMIARADEKLKVNTDSAKSLAALQKLFTDANSADYYAVPSIEAVTKAGLIEGKENVLLQGQKKTTLRFDPNENFTRAEAAVVAARVMRQQKKFPK